MSYQYIMCKLLPDLSILRSQRHVLPTYMWSRTRCGKQVHSGVQGFGILELSGQSTRVDQWLGSAAHRVPIEVGEGPAALRGFSVITESGHPIVFREPLTFIDEAQSMVDCAPEEACTRPGKVPSLEDNADDPTDGSATPHAEHSEKATANASMLGSVLEQVEQALESAAIVVENVAGDIISPKAGHAQTQL